MKPTGSLIELDSLEPLKKAHENYKYAKQNRDSLIEGLCDKWVETEYPKKSLWFKWRTRNKNNKQKAYKEYGIWTLVKICTEEQYWIVYDFNSWYASACEANQIIKSGNQNVYASTSLLLFINTWVNFDRSIMEVK